MLEIDEKATGREIRKKAEEKGITEKDIASKMFLTRAAVNNWMNGSRIPRIDNILILAEMFECKVEDIVKTRRTEV